MAVSCAFLANPAVWHVNESISVADIQKGDRWRIDNRIPLSVQAWKGPMNDGRYLSIQTDRPVFDRRHAHLLAEQSGEMLGILETKLLGNTTD
jgi:hypothetical protein